MEEEADSITELQKDIEQQLEKDSKNKRAKKCELNIDFDDALRLNF